jgi:acyl-CoA thioester hydrolase
MITIHLSRCAPPSPQVPFSFPPPATALSSGMASPFVIEEYVRWSDVDFAGIIFYGSYVRFFELAETELFRAAGLPFGTVFDQYDVFLPRVQVHTEFHFPPRLDDHLAVAAYIGRVGRSSMTIEFEVVRRPDGTHCADGHMVLVCVDRAKLKPCPIPQGFITQLEPFTLSRAEARRQLGIAEPAA